MTISKGVSWKDASRLGTLTIRGLQFTDGQEDRTEVTTSARYVIKDGKRYLFYKEYMEEGNQQQVRMIIGEDQVTLRKTGPGRTEMIFRKGASEPCHYQSVIGPMELVSRTRKIHRKESRHQMLLKMEYSLYMNGQLMSDYVLHIRWEEKE